MNLFIFHIHSITPRQSIPYPDIMTKDRHYQLGITVMTLISHNLHTQVIMAWLRKKILFFQKRRRSSDKKTQKCWVILYQHLCVFQDVCQIPLWFLIQYPHIFYTNIQSPSPYAMLSYTQMSHVTPCFIILRSTARHPIKIWCIYLKNN